MNSFGWIRNSWELCDIATFDDWCCYDVCPQLLSSINCLPLPSSSLNENLTQLLSLVDGRVHRRLTSLILHSSNRIIALSQLFSATCGLIVSPPSFSILHGTFGGRARGWSWFLLSYLRNLAHKLMVSNKGVKHVCNVWSCTGFSFNKVTTESSGLVHSKSLKLVCLRLITDVFRSKSKTSSLNKLSLIESN